MAVPNYPPFEPGFVPPKNLQYFLLILRKMKSVKGRTKLFKIHSLIEEEGLVKYSLPIDTYPYGPVDYETFNFCRANELIEDRLVQTPDRYDYFETALTMKGRAFFEKYCMPNMEGKELRSAVTVISRYRSVPGMKILEHVHRKFVDPFRNRENVEAYTNEAISRVDVVYNIAQKDTNSIETDNLLMELRHIKEILKSLFEVKDPTKVGVLLVNLNYMLQSLKINNYTRSGESVEFFEFLDHYANKEHIQRSLSSPDFSDIPMDVRERLFEKILEAEVPAMGARLEGKHAIAQPTG